MYFRLSVSIYGKKRRYTPSNDPAETLLRQGKMMMTRQENLSSRLINSFDLVSFSYNDECSSLP